MLITWRLWACHLITSLLPETRLFALKGSLLRWCGATIGRNVRICSSVKVMGTGVLEIGDDVWIGPDVMISSNSKVRIGSSVDIAPQVFIGTGTHMVDLVGSHVAGQGVNLNVTIDDGAWLGVRCVILPGVSINRKAIVAAGAVVTRDVPSFSLVAGVPAATKKIMPTSVDINSPP